MMLSRRSFRVSTSLAFVLALGCAAPALAEDDAPPPAPASSAAPPERPVPTPPRKPKSLNSDAAAKDAKSGTDAQKSAPDEKPRLSAGEVVAKANAYFDGARVMTADFVQIGPDGARVEGSLHVMRPGRMLFRFNPPSPLEIVADGRSVAVRDQTLGTQDLYFIAQTPLKFLLQDKIDLAKDTVVKRVQIDDNAAMIELEDKATFGGVSAITLIFDPASFALKQWTVIDPQGYQTVVTLFDVDLVTQPDPAMFHIDEAINSGPANRKH